MTWDAHKLWMKSNELWEFCIILLKVKVCQSEAHKQWMPLACVEALKPS